MTSRPVGSRHCLVAPSLVVADGRFSSLSGRHPRKSRVGWFGWNASYAGVDQAAGALSLHFGRDGYVGLLTFGDGVTNVCGLVYSSGTGGVRGDDVLTAAVREQPALAELLRDADEVGRVSRRRAPAVLARDVGGSGTTSRR